MHPKAAHLILSGCIVKELNGGIWVFRMGCRYVLRNNIIGGWRIETLAHHVRDDGSYPELRDIEWKGIPWRNLRWGLITLFLE